LKTFSHYIGRGFAWARDQVARGLARAGVTPNMLTLLGLAITCTAAGFMGGGRWMIAGLLLIAAGACDMLDGALARIGGKASRFGGVLDSTCDRVGDVALMVGLAGYYLFTWPALNAQPANLTYGLLAVLAVINVTEISYIRARAREELADCEVGFWRRGERYAAIVIGMFAANPAIVLWQLGVGAALTAGCRLICARRAFEGRPRPNAERSLVERMVFFDEARGTWAYDLYTGLNIALLIAARIPSTDLLRRLLDRLSGG